MSEEWRGKVGALAQDEVDEFLAEGRIARLACLDADGWPYVVPVWHEWDGSAFWLVAREPTDLAAPVFLRHPLNLRHDSNYRN